MEIFLDVSKVRQQHSGLGNKFILTLIQVWQDSPLYLLYPSIIALHLFIYIPTPPLVSVLLEDI